MERSTKHEAKLILTWLISAAMIGLYWRVTPVISELTVKPHGRGRECVSKKTICAT
jgi:hypothetical protein